jgi:DNA polymerase III subunit alpha
VTGQCNLHQHSEGSFDDGYATVAEIAARANEVGAEAVAITDHGEVSQHLAFQKACRAEGVHPVLGMEGYWVNDVAEVKAAKSRDNSHICLLAENNTGLHNLWALSSLGYTRDNFYYKPLITPDLMREYRAGLWASDGCMLTALGRAVEAGDYAAARQYIVTLADIFGDRLYVELHTWQYLDPDTAEKRRLNELMRDINQAKASLADELGVPLVVVNDSHHAWPEDWEAKELKVKYKKTADDHGQKADHLMAGDELYGWMERHGIPAHVVTQAIKNSAMIAESCHAEITKTLDMPRMTRSQAEDAAALAGLVEAGFIRKVVGAGLPEPVYRARVEAELKLITDKGFAGYFLMEHDLIDACTTGSWASVVTAGAAPAPMLLGPGRGSAGASLVAYLLGLTAVDPLRYDLDFDRFLTPGRKDYPDIDIDLPASTRDDAKSYLAERHGHDHVCGMSTLIRSGPKTALRDAAREMGIPMADVNQMSKIIDRATVTGDEGEADWDEVKDTASGELVGWVRKYPDLFGWVDKLAGRVRQSGTHASGMVIANRPVLGAIPTRTQDGATVAAVEMGDVAALGGVKMDLLSSRHMDTLTVARDLIAQRHGVWLDFRGDGNRGAKTNGCPVVSFGEPELTDPNIWLPIGAGHTLGIFQIETAIGTRVASRFKPTSVTDLAAMVSIVRPGVRDAGLTDEFLRRRAGAPVTYDHPLMAEITGETHGVLIYQEQLLRAARELAGFTADEADDLRKALSKKNIEVVRSLKDKFIAGCLGNPSFTDGCENPTEAAGRIWSSIQASGRYAFNKAHAIGYALVATWEIWTKHHYPVEYIAALLATDTEKDNRTRYIREARRLGVTIAPPDINRSGTDFTLDSDTLRHGLSCVEGLGSVAANHIITGRPYTGLNDYLARARRGVHKPAVDNLILLGAFDELGVRADLLRQLEYHRATEDLAESTKTNPQRLQARVEHRLAKDENRINIPDFDNPRVVGEIEQQLTGSWITADPTAPYAADIAKWCVNSPAEIELCDPGAEFWLGGEVGACKVITDRRNRPMAFLTVLWNSHEFEVAVFSDEWLQHGNRLIEGMPVICKARKDDRGRCHLIELANADYFTTTATR